MDKLSQTNSLTLSLLNMCIESLESRIDHHQTNINKTFSEDVVYPGVVYDGNLNDHEANRPPEGVEMHNAVPIEPASFGYPFTAKNVVFMKVNDVAPRHVARMEFNKREFCKSKSGVFFQIYGNCIMQSKVGLICSVTLSLSQQPEIQMLMYPTKPADVAMQFEAVHFDDTYGISGRLLVLCIDTQYRDPERCRSVIALLNGEEIQSLQALKNVDQYILKILITLLYGEHVCGTQFK
eukprot:757907_1